VVLVVADLSGTQVLEVIDELDGFDPLDLLEPEFVLAAETERGAVMDVERLDVHFVTEQRQFMLHVFKDVIGSHVHSMILQLASRTVMLPSIVEEQRGD
jgi:hypothetical protein